MKLKYERHFKAENKNEAGAALALHGWLTEKFPEWSVYN
jgi:hypothetical protein